MSTGYLGFTLGPDGRTLYYLPGGPIDIDGKRVTGKGKMAMLAAGRSDRASLSKVRSGP